MLPPRLDATGVKPVGAVSPTPAAIPVSDARQAAFQRSLSGMVGQTMKGEVLSKYDDGSYLVRVAGNAARMMLPGGAQVGAEVPLTLIATTPRPTFQVGSGAQGTQTAQLYTETGLPPGDTPDAPATQPRLPSQDSTGLPGRPPGQPGQAAGQGAATSGQAGAAGGQPAATQPGAGLPSTAQAAGQPGSPGAAVGTGAGAPGTAAWGAAGTGAGAAGAAIGKGAADADGPAGTTAGTGTSNASTAGNATNAGNAASAAATAAAAQARAGLAAQTGNTNLQANLRNAAQSAAANASATSAGNAASNPGAAGQVRSHSLAATLLGRAPLTPADQLPDLSHDAPTAALSAAARSIASALAGAYNNPGVPATINGKTPLVSAGVPDADQLAHGLKNALGESGLFYESHVAEWAEGKRPLQELMREPQNQRAQAQAQQSGPQTSETLARAALAGPDLSAAQMINQQLHAHEQQRVQWNGQAWPGQPMQWEVQRDQREGSPQGQDDGTEPEQVWRSGVRFRLPLLGKIAATVTLVGEQVHIQVQTADGGSADTLRAWSGQLQLALEAAGSPLSSLTISQDADAPVSAVAALPGGGDAE